MKALDALEGCGVRRGVLGPLCDFGFAIVIISTTTHMRASREHSLDLHKSVITSPQTKFDCQWQEGMANSKP